MKIIIDAVGGDNAPEQIVLGALQAAKEYGVKIIIDAMGGNNATEQIIKGDIQAVFHC